MKFDFVIGNPPYQDSSIGDNKTYQPPIYHHFLDNAYKISDKVMMVHPARCLFDAGATPHDWNHKILHDKHFKVSHYEQESSKIFADTEIKGGVAITYRDKRKNYGEIDVFVSNEQLRTIMNKVINKENFCSFSSIVGGRNQYRFTLNLHKDHPKISSRLSKGHETDLTSNIFEKLPDVLTAEKPKTTNHYRILGRIDNDRAFRYVNKEYIAADPVINKFKVFIPEVSGKGTFGEVLTASEIGRPGDLTTETFLTIGSFDNEKTARALQQYMKTRFARTLLNILKITQHNTRKKWAKVPLQDFTQKSDIDWSLSLREIDQQLYKKYNLTKSEIDFIENNVQEMR